MSNTLGNYNPTFFANEALIQLYEQLGMAGRVHRGADEERTTAGRQLGDIINLRRPTKFQAKEHVEGVGSEGQDVVGENVQIRLNNHQEVKFKLTDRELAYSGERIINEHIRPAAYALGHKIDTDLHALGQRVGPKAVLKGTASSQFITGPRKILRNNAVPIDGNVHYLIDSGMEAAFLDMGIFHEAQTVGGTDNQDALYYGSLGRRFGVEVFASQNADVSVAGMGSSATASSGGDLAGAAAGAQAANAPTLAVDGFGATETVEIGDTFTIADDPTVYTITAPATFSGGATTFQMYPALRRNTPDNAVVTLVQLDAVEEEVNIRNLMFHRNAFALAFAELPRTGDGRGAQIETVTDFETGLSLRARMWYDGGTATNWVALDALYGTQVLDPMLATRVIRSDDVYPAN